MPYLMEFLVFLPSPKNFNYFSGLLMQLLSVNMWIYFTILSLLLNLLLLVALQCPV